MDDRANNFDALRFWAALAVLWSHAFPIALGAEYPQPLGSLSHGQTNLGSVAVAFFFVISGYLITRSFEHSTSTWSFVRARALRIMPGLIVVLIAVAFLLGPLVTSIPLREYFTSSAPYRYVVMQASFSGHAELPGVFDANPVEHSNDSLWTLRYEVACYVLVFLLGYARVLTRYVTLGLYLAIVAALGVLEHLPAAHGEVPGPDRLLDFTALFLAGAVIYQWRVPLRANWAWAGFAIVALCMFFGEYKTAQRIALPYVVIVLAQGVRWKLWSPIKLGDLSYGIYIYAWPITQLAVMALPQPTWFAVGLLATPITLLLAWLSWHVVEKRALALKALDRRTRAIRLAFSLPDTSTLPFDSGRLSMGSSDRPTRMSARVTTENRAPSRARASDKS
jgi:peptidoglycan/LPS O-acetylase OafA/YrhL